MASSIIFIAEGYDSKTITNPSASSQTIQLNATATTTLTVTDCDTSQPISGASVGTTGAYTTDSNGKVEFESCDDLAACAGESNIILSNVNSSETLPSTGGTLDVYVKYYGIPSSSYIELSTTGFFDGPEEISQVRNIRPSGTTATGFQYSPYTGYSMTASAKTLSCYSRAVPGPYVESNDLTFSQGVFAASTSAQTLAYNTASTSFDIRNDDGIRPNITVSSTAWLDLDGIQTLGSGRYRATFTCSQNTGSTSRTITVTVKPSSTSSISIPVRITQNGQSQPTTNTYKVRYYFKYQDESPCNSDGFEVPTTGINVDGYSFYVKGSQRTGSGEYTGSIGTSSTSLSSYIDKTFYSTGSTYTPNIATSSTLASFATTTACTGCDDESNGRAVSFRVEYYTDSSMSGTAATWRSIIHFKPYGDSSWYWREYHTGVLDPNTQYYAKVKITRLCDQ